MAVRLLLSGAEVARVRMAVSPLAETVFALKLVRSSGAHAIHQRWLHDARPKLVRDPGLPLLSRLVTGHTPSFLFPVPETRTPSFDDELERLRLTTDDYFDAELTDAFGPDAYPELRRNPRKVLGDIADTLQRCHAAVIEQHWGRMRAVLDADIDWHLAILAERGVEGLFEVLHSEIAWRNGELVVYGESRPGSVFTVDVGGHGLVLSPTVFSWPNVCVDRTPLTAGTLRYPARGVGLLWDRPATIPDGLASVLGRTRAALLETLFEPLSTGQLAARIDVTPGAVSQHLGALRNAGLVATRREGRTALHLRTEAGAQLATAGDGNRVAAPT